MQLVKRTVLVLGALLFLGLFAEIQAAEKKVKVFILAGQSNMAGRGEVKDEDRTIQPRVLMLAKDGSWQFAVDPIHSVEFHPVVERALHRFQQDRRVG